jgi:hypothetical protein
MGRSGTVRPRAAAEGDYVLELPSLLYGGASQLALSRASRLIDVPRTRSVGLFRWRARPLLGALR